MATAKKVKETPKKKTLTKKEKEIREFKIFNLKSKIESAEIGLDRYVSAIVRSAFIENCTGGAYFNDLFMKELHNGFEAIRKSKKPKALKDKLFNEIAWGTDGNPGEDKEVFFLEVKLKHKERLVGWAKDALKNENDDKKKEIILDSIEQKAAWSRQFDKTYQICEALK